MNAPPAKMFMGCIESDSDPQGLGQCRVRILGVDSISRQETPTEALPWASVMLPTNSAQGSVRAPKIGTWVIGFYGLNDDDYQTRIIIGTLNTHYQNWQENPSDPAAGTGVAGPMPLVPPEKSKPGQMDILAQLVRPALDVMDLTGTGKAPSRDVAEMFGFTPLDMDTSFSIENLKEIRDRIKQIQSDGSAAGVTALATLGAYPQLQNIGLLDDFQLQDLVDDKAVEGFGQLVDIGNTLSAIPVNVMSVMNLDMSNLGAQGSLNVGQSILSTGVTITDSIISGLEGLDQIDASSLALNFQSAEQFGDAVDKLAERGVKVITNAGEVIADKAAEVWGDISGQVEGAIDTLGDIGEGALDSLADFDLSNVDLSDIGGSIEGAIEGGIQNLTETLAGSELARAGIQIAAGFVMAQPEVRAAIAQAMEIISMIKQVQSMLQMAGQIQQGLQKISVMIFGV